MEFKIPKSKALGPNFVEPKKQFGASFASGIGGYANSTNSNGPDKREFYVNLHLSFDGYKPVRMPEIPPNYDEDEPHFTLYRMVPSG